MRAKLIVLALLIIGFALSAWGALAWDNWVMFFAAAVFSGAGAAQCGALGR